MRKRLENSGRAFSFVRQPGSFSERVRGEDAIYFCSGTGSFGNRVLLESFAAPAAPAALAAAGALAGLRSYFAGLNQMGEV
jgi:hypothetical protein